MARELTATPSACPTGALVTTDESTREEAAPDPDDPGKPDSPTYLTKRSALYVVRKTAREFSKDQCTDLAEALTPTTQCCRSLPRWW
jgi:hypothetical protein